MVSPKSYLMYLKGRILNYQFDSDAFLFKRISLTATVIPVDILSWCVLMQECQYVLKEWEKLMLLKLLIFISNKIYKETVRFTHWRK